MRKLLEELAKEGENESEMKTRLTEVKASQAEMKTRLNNEIKSIQDKLIQDMYER